MSNNDAPDPRNIMTFDRTFLGSEDFVRFIKAYYHQDPEFFETYFGNVLEDLYALPEHGITKNKDADYLGIEVAQWTKMKSCSDNRLHLQDENVCICGYFDGTY